MSTRATIITALVSALEGITTANGYSTTVAEVKRGLHDYEDFQLLPAISLWCPAEVMADQANGQFESKQKARVWLHVAGDDPATLDAFIADVKKALFNDWAYWADTHPGGELATWEQEPMVAVFDLFIEYEHNKETP